MPDRNGGWKQPPFFIPDHKYNNKFSKCDARRISHTMGSLLLRYFATRGNNMKQATMVKKIGDMLYKNGLMAIALGLYIGIYSANLDKVNL